MRYSGQRGRATTNKTYAMGNDYNKILEEAKRLHRIDSEFYLSKMYNYFTSISIKDYEIYDYSNFMLEHWKFIEGRWHKVNDISVKEV